MKLNNYMKRDFTISVFKQLIKVFQENGYEFSTVRDFHMSSKIKSIILRHDIDRLPENALNLAHTEHDFGVHGTYYFRVVPESFNKNIIKRIANMGHEIGYHYEDVSLMARKIKKIKDEKTLIDTAIKSFELNLQKIREVAPVDTICMHGSPLSKWDNRAIWKYYSYALFDVVKEPYFDIDFSKVLYLTDTGRRWNGDNVNVRDKEIILHPDKHEQNPFLSENYNYSSTFKIISAINKNFLPTSIMLTVHPQRWTNSKLFWTEELIAQNLKNSIKYLLIHLSKKAKH